MKTISIAQALESLHEAGAPPTTSCGICHYLLTVDELAEPSCGVSVWLMWAFEQLGLDECFPVPHPEIPSNRSAYDRTRNLWEGQYGANRLHLVELLIQLAEGWEPPAYYKVQWPYPYKPTK